MMVSRLFLLVLLSCCLSVHASGSRINIVNNGYRDIVVAISPDVPPDEADDLLDNIQLLITEASYDLYEATRHRSYIESVRILIPQTWVNVAANASTWENFQDADIHIDLPNWKLGDKPYTVQLGGCGDPGEYIHFTPNYVMNFYNESNLLKFGPGGKVFVREWARLRYGVFEEHGYTGDDSAFPMFYRSASTHQTADLVPNVCSNEPVNDFTFDYGCYVDPVTGLYDTDCTYSFTNQFKPGSSIMSDYRMLSSAMDFCDDDASSTNKHNREAPNKQNAICDNQSVWSVISRHVDFAEGNNLPTNTTDFIPTFNIVQVVNGARYVLVTDVSGSMVNYNRITRLNQSARRWIQYDIPDGTSLGIVKFGYTATLQINMTVVSDTTRQQLMDEVPNSVGGGTCIGCGLLMAVETLSPGGKGGVIVLVTDGQETIQPYIRDVYPQLIDSEAQVVSIAFGQAAEEEIEVLATKTKGKSYFINDVGNVDGLNDAFTGSLTYLPAVPSEDLTVLLHEAKYQNPENTFTSLVLVDYTVGRELTFRVDYTNINYLQTFSVMSPNGLLFNNLIVGNDTKAPTAFIKIPDVADDGYWDYTLTVANSPSDSANVIVTTKSKSSSGPITVECFVPGGSSIDASVTPVRLVAVVKQRNNFVIGAEVRAFVERPNTALEVIELVDTGVGADTNKSDGIYSRYYTDPTNAGRYTLVCDVKSTNSTYIEDGESDQQLRTTTGDLARYKSGGSFRVAVPLKKTFPPNRVTDLKVVAMQVDQMSVTIQWTAPGQELDIGTATEYLVKYSDAFDNLLEGNFNSNLSLAFEQQDVLDGSLQPLESGSKQRVTLALPRTTDDVTYYIALRALNINKASSSTSNIVSVQIAPIKPPQTQPPPTTKTTTPTTTSTSTTKAPETSTSVNTGCNSVLTSSSGLLTSPDYPGPYPDDYDCQWIIRVASASKIRLTFSHFDIETFDFVEVYDGASVSGRLLLKHSGSTVPGDVVSSSNEMLVRFVTDGTGNYFRGWRATYTSS